METMSTDSNTYKSRDAGAYIIKDGVPVEYVPNRNIIVQAINTAREGQGVVRMTFLQHDIFETISDGEFMIDIEKHADFMKENNLKVEDK